MDDRNSHTHPGLRQTAAQGLSHRSADTALNSTLYFLTFATGARVSGPTRPFREPARPKPPSAPSGHMTLREAFLLVSRSDTALDIRRPQTLPAATGGRWNLIRTSARHLVRSP